MDWNHEVEARFTGLPSWRQWLAQNPWLVDPAYVAAMIADIRQNGLLDPLQGDASPLEIVIDESNLRESILFRGINSRCRAVLKILADWPTTSVIYASESLTPFANLLRQHFPNFSGSEYLPTASELGKFADARHEDVQALSFATESIDVYISCDVMEHIPSVSAALREAARVLRPGGVLIATFPFRAMEQDTLTKAVLENGEPRFLMEPEYHGNPLDPQGSLVFSIPGWDILDTARASGLAAAEMVAMSSRRYGILAATPILVMRAIR
jgi:SAM-dependent methyltransferase